LSYITNLGQAVSEGADVQADIAVTDAFTLESAIGYNDAHYTTNAYPGTPTGSPITTKGDAIVGQSGAPGAPWTVTIGAEYKFKAFEHDSFEEQSADGGGGFLDAAVPVLYDERGDDADL
jgi:hypothetical protein